MGVRAAPGVLCAACRKDWRCPVRVDRHKGRCVGKPYGYGPQDGGNENKVYGLVDGVGMIGAVERELVFQVEVETQKTHLHQRLKGDCVQEIHPETANLISWHV